MCVYRYHAQKSQIIIIKVVLSLCRLSIYSTGRSLSDRERELFIEDCNASTTLFGVEKRS